VDARRLAFPLVFGVLVLPACGGAKLTATGVASFERKLSPGTFADISCTPDRSSGWDFVCTYTDPQQGREKIGVAVHGGRVFGGSGSVPAADLLPDGPHTKSPGRAEYARRADAVCAKRVAAVRALPKPKNQSQLLDVGQRMVFLEELERSRLAGITPPVGERPQVVKLMSSITEIERATESFRDALTRRDAADLAGAEKRLKTVRALANSTARDLGMNCRH
jgi:hypothetical protein